MQATSTPVPHLATLSSVDSFVFVTASQARNRDVGKLTNTLIHMKMYAAEPNARAIVNNDSYKLQALQQRASNIYGMTSYLADIAKNGYRVSAVGLTPSFVLISGFQEHVSPTTLPVVCFLDQLLPSPAHRDPHQDCLACSRSLAAFARALLHTNLDLLVTNVATDCGHILCPTRRRPQSRHTSLCPRRLVLRYQRVL